ncbi:hypothetical protein NQ317_015953 [Molorchus minor]|uniref:ATP synthase subunit s, mitochondrial n=1 Tax=Molorchus minor TaxID=1323400 RepID=A0ABQ9JL02_9CUCU|nr:hypothetical protein NQ317_015953 [Molorchus minor]
MATPNRGETVQKQIQQDWLNREYIEIITINLSCRSKLAVLNEKLTTLERKIDYLEACFNAVDEERFKVLGPDRTCAEWILRNGGAVKWVNSNELLKDYNELPNEGTTFHIQEIDASNASIMQNGFAHFNGCNYITKIIFHECNYLENGSFEGLKYLKNSLLFLQISSCPNITENGLFPLKILSKLKQLVMLNLIAVKNKDKVLQNLKK